MKKTLFLLLFLFSSLCNAQSQRVITAGSAITETVCALGLCESIVASDRTSLYPPQIASLPSIGYRNSINAEGIIALRPTLVIAEKDYVEGAVLEQIQSVGIKTIIIKREYSFEGTKDMVRQIAAALDKKSEGEKLLLKIETQLSEARELIKKSSIKSPRVLCVYNRGTSSLDVAGKNTFSSTLPYAGAVNAIEGVEGYKPLNAEALIASNPDCILFFESGLKSLGGVDGALNIAGVAATRAGKERKIIAMEGIKISNFGPRFGEAVNELVRLIYTDLDPKP